MAPTIVLITGANRGLGLGLTKLFLEKPNYIVVAAVRDPTHPTSQELLNLPTGEGSRVVVVKYDASVEQSAFDAVKDATSQGVDHLDYIVANAAIATGLFPVKDVERDALIEHYQVNVLGVVSLYQATRDLLQKSTISPQPVFASVGSMAGSLGNHPPIPNAAYGPTKSVLLWYGLRINAEDEWLNAFDLDPGWVQTEMGNAGAKLLGMESAPETIENSTAGMVNVITKGSKKQYGGKFVRFSGEVEDY